MARNWWESAAAIAFAGLAMGLFLLAFLPWAAWLGFARSEEVVAYSGTVLHWVRWTALVFFSAALLSVVAGKRVDDVLERWRAKVDRLSGKGYALAIAAMVVTAGAVLSKVLFAHNPHLVDTIAQLFQARIFVHGSLTAPAPDHYEFFAFTHSVQHEGRWFSQYPPGHPTFLALGLLVGIPWAVNPLFAGGTVLLVYGAARRLLGDGSAKLAVALYILSPFVLFMGASYMNHVTAGFFLALALYAAVRQAGCEGGYRWALLTGAALALAATIRPLEAAAWAGVLGFWILHRRDWKGALSAGGACLLCLAPLFIYNALTTGAPLRFAYALLWGTGQGLGFHTDPWGEPFTPLKSFANTAQDFQRLNVLLFGWPFPSLIFAVAALGIAAVDSRMRKNWALLAALLLAAPVAHFFYWHRDNYLGPRFLYASLIPAILLTAAGISALDRRLGRWRSAFRTALLAALGFGLAVSLPHRAGTVAGLEPAMKLHPEVEAERRGLKDAVVFVKVGWGSRLIARLWGWRVPASETERTYRAVDGCRLQSVLDEADSVLSVSGDSLGARHLLERRLLEWRELELPLNTHLLPDPTVRVDTTRPLDDRCVKEILRDSSGFTHYGTLVWRNDPWLQRGVVYVRDLGPELNQRLVSGYPKREYYLYAPFSSEPGAPPVLRRVDARPLASGSSPNHHGGSPTPQPVRPD